MKKQKRSLDRLPDEDKSVKGGATRDMNGPGVMSIPSVGKKMMPQGTVSGYPLFIYQMILLLDLVGCVALVSSMRKSTYSWGKCAALGLVVLHMLFCLYRTYRVLLARLSLRLSKFCEELDSIPVDNMGPFLRALRELLNRFLKFSTKSTPVAYRGLKGNELLRKIVYGVENMGKLRRESRLLPITAKVLSGILSNISKYMGLGKLVSKIKTALRERRATREPARRLIKREMDAVRRRRRGILSLVDRLRSGRVEKTKKSETADRERGKMRGNRERTGEPVSDRDRATIADEVAKIMGSYRKFDDSLKEDYGDLRQRARAIEEIGREDSGLGLKAKLDREIATGKLLDDSSARITKDCNILNKMFEKVLDTATKLTEEVTGIEINGDGVRGFGWREEAEARGVEKGAEESRVNRMNESMDESAGKGRGRETDSTPARRHDSQPAPTPAAEEGRRHLSSTSTISHLSGCVPSTSGSSSIPVTQPQVSPHPREKNPTRGTLYK
ncbi:MAG: hypothetical protein LBB24_00195 [Rickettsiales bacterium]|nr:hypothetical protein [Rickettsiales bacterium]